MTSSSAPLGNISTIPSCNPTPCAPCYYSFNAYTIDTPWEIVNQTSTVSLVAYVTEMADGSLETEYSTINQQTANATDDSLTTFVSDFVWTEGPHTLTYPTTYLSIVDLSGKGTSQWESMPNEVCTPTANLSSIELPEATDPAFFLLPITPAAATDGSPSLDAGSLSVTSSSGETTSEAQETSTDAVLPASILSYLDSLSTVREQFGNAAITSCLPATKISQPDLCTEVREVPRLGPCPGTNRTSTCTLGISTITKTRTKLIKSTSAATVESSEAPAATTRISAGSLTNKVVSTSYVKHSSEVPDPAPQNLPDEDPKQSGAEPEKPSPTSPPDDLPSQTAKDPSPPNTPAVGSNPDPVNQEGQDAPPPDDHSDQPDVDSGTAGHNENPSEEGGHTSSSGSDSPAQGNPPSDSNSEQQAGSQDHGTGSAQNNSPQQGSQSAPGQSEDSGDAADSQNPGVDFGVLNSAIQAAASQASVSRAAAPQDGGSATAQDSDPVTDATISSSDNGPTNQPVGSAGEASGRATSNAATEPGTFTSAPPVFTFQDQTLTAGGAATFGGSVVSELPNQDGVVVDGTRTVHLADGQATTVVPNGQEPITISRSGSIYVVDGQTLSPGQQISAGRTTASLGTSTGILYVNGVPTTLAGPSITLGGTVYTAATQSPSSDGGLGGFVYSGIGGSAPVSTGGPTEGSSNGTGVTPSTGNGSRPKAWGWAVPLCGFAAAAAVWMI